MLQKGPSKTVPSAETQKYQCQHGSARAVYRLLIMASVACWQKGVNMARNTNQNEIATLGMTCIFMLSEGKATQSTADPTCPLLPRIQLPSGT